MLMSVVDHHLTIHLSYSYFRFGFGPMETRPLWSLLTSYFALLYWRIYICGIVFFWKSKHVVVERLVRVGWSWLGLSNAFAFGHLGCSSQVCFGLWCDYVFSRGRSDGKCVSRLACPLLGTLRVMWRIYAIHEALCSWLCAILPESDLHQSILALAQELHFSWSFKEIFEFILILGQKLVSFKHLYLRIDQQIK